MLDVVVTQWNSTVNFFYCIPHLERLVPVFTPDYGPSKIHLEVEVTVLILTPGERKEWSKENPNVM